MRRVAITGIGLVTPIGNDLESTWSALLAGKSGAAPITQFDCTNFSTKFACEVKNWDPLKWMDKRELKHLDRFLQFSLGASMMAMEDAGLGNVLLDVSLDVVGRVLHGLDLLGVFLRNRDLELLLEREHELDHRERVRLEIVDERRFGTRLLGGHLELIADDFLDLALDLLRGHFPRS